MSVQKKKTPAIRRRDPVRTKAELMQAALEEFADHGFHGARVERITRAAGCNTRLLYHYFGNKEDLYFAVLEHIYAGIRDSERQLNLGRRDPVDAIRALVEFTFDFFDTNTHFVKITRNENLLGGRFIERTPSIGEMSRPLLAEIDAVLARGQADGSFRQRMDPLQLYVTIVALSAHHLNSTHTLSATFGTDLGREEWRAERRRHAVSFTMQALGVDPSGP